MSYIKLVVTYGGGGCGRGRRWALVDMPESVKTEVMSHVALLILIQVKNYL